MPSRRCLGRGRILALAVVATILVLLLDLVGGPGPSVLRRAGGAALGPLERALSPGDGAIDAVRAERDALADEVRQLRAGRADSAALAALLAAPTTQGARVVPARVVAVGAPGASGPERVTIDAGSRDGVEVDRTVVTDGGLVGRVVAVAPWTSDVALIGSPDVVVGVRVGARGLLGSIGSRQSGNAGPRDPRDLSLQLVAPGALAAGDAVTTLGSVDGRPFVAGVRVGTVRTVDPERGLLAPSAAVTPAVDVARLNIVGVLLTAPRSAPRAAATGR
jgi:rod shape-determining protein MreC